MKALVLFFMRCSHCGLCCTKTEMLLSEADVERLENAGYKRESFVRLDDQGYLRLRNRRGHCVLLDPKRNNCKVYGRRPLGCQVYPVIYSVEEGVIIDELCPMSNSISAKEQKAKGKKVVKLLENIDKEASKRKRLT